MVEGCEIIKEHMFGRAAHSRLLCINEFRLNRFLRSTHCKHPYYRPNQCAIRMDISYTIQMKSFFKKTSTNSANAGLSWGLHIWSIKISV